MSTEDGTRVVITGIGLRTALGGDRESTWAALRAGRSGGRWLDEPAVGSGPPFAGFPLPEGSRRTAAVLLGAADDALADAGLREGHPIDRTRCATVVGVSKGDLDRLARLHVRVRDRDAAPPIDPAWFGGWPGGAASCIAELLKFRGPSLAPIAACATGVVAVLRAADLIRRGEADVAIAGAGDASLEPLVLGAFRRMGALAKVAPGANPAAAMRPLDRRRSGFLPGEGAALLVLEREEHARARGVAAYAEVAGGALGSDAYHLTDLNPDPANLAGLIGRALESAGVSPGEIDHVNLHGTATRSNDPLECRAVRRVFGAHADDLLACANKAQIGHTLGAAGAVELAIACLSLRDGFIPPTLNREEPDPACDLATTPISVARPIRTALKLSLGFGGHLAAAVLRRVESCGRTAVASADHAPIA